MKSDTFPQIPQFLYHFNISVKFPFECGFAFFSTPKQRSQWYSFDRNRFIVTILGDYVHNICKWRVCGILWHNKLFRFCTTDEDDELSHWTDTKSHYPWVYIIFNRWAANHSVFLFHFIWFLIASMRTSFCNRKTEIRMSSRCENNVNLKNKQKWK